MRIDRLMLIVFLGKKKNNSEETLGDSPSVGLPWFPPQLRQASPFWLSVIMANLGCLICIQNAAAKIFSLRSYDASPHIPVLAADALPYPAHKPLVLIFKALRGLAFPTLSLPPLLCQIPALDLLSSPITKISIIRWSPVLLRGNPLSPRPASLWLHLPPPTRTVCSAHSFSLKIPLRDALFSKMTLSASALLV